MGVREPRGAGGPSRPPAQPVEPGAGRGQDRPPGLRVRAGPGGGRIGRARASGTRTLEGVRWVRARARELRVHLRDEIAEPQPCPRGAQNLLNKD